MNNKWYKLRYVGESFGVDELTNGKTYYAIDDSEHMYRVIDDSLEDYLYSKTNPAPTDESSKGGKWELLETYDIVEPDGSLLVINDIDKNITDFNDKNTILNLIDKTKYDQKIDEYLRSGKVIMMKNNVLEDLIDPDKGSIGTEIWYSDGKYKWSSFCIYYYEQYGFKLDENFIKSIKKY